MDMICYWFVGDTLMVSYFRGIIYLLHYLSVLSCKKSMGFVWATNEDLVCAHFVCEISSLPGILWIVVSGFASPVIQVSLQLTLSKPKHSYSAI